MRGCNWAILGWLAVPAPACNKQLSRHYLHEPNYYRTVVLVPLDHERIIGQSGAVIHVLETRAAWEDSLPYRVEVGVAVVHGAVVCTSLHIDQKVGGPPINRHGVDKLPIPALIRNTAAAGALHLNEDGSLSPRPERQRTTERDLQPRGGRRARPDDVDQKAAQCVKIARELWAAGQRTRYKPLIAKEMYCSVSYVGVLLARAEKLGILDPAERPARGGKR